MNKEEQEAYEKIAKALEIAKEQIELAQKIADEHALYFTWDLAYGMGGTYEGKGTKNDGGGWGNRTNGIRPEGEWVSSSSNC